MIASSPTDLQPVFSAIAESAKRLLGGFAALITRLIGDDLHLGALTSTSPAGDEAARARFPRAVTTFGIHTVAARTRAPFAVADIEADQWLSHPGLQEMARARGWRSFLAVPMLQGDQVLGTIGVSRREAGAFKPEEIALLQTFADQAVIAIENVRLFTELEEKNRALTHGPRAGDRGARSADRDERDPPGYRELADRSAARVGCGRRARSRLCEARTPTIYLRRRRGAATCAPLTVCSRAARLGDSTLPLTRRHAQWPGGHRVPRLTVADLPERGPGVPEAPPSLAATAIARPSRPAAEGRRGDRDHLSATGGGTALLRAQIALLKTFADQAVIAIENVRLFKELRSPDTD